MKKTVVVIGLIMLGVLSGCKKDSRDMKPEVTETEGTGQKVTEQKVTEPKSSYIDDYLEILSRENSEFVVLRVKDAYLEVTRDYEMVYVGKEGEYPELEDGQMARVVADVDIYDGGMAGYSGNKFITDLKQYEVLDYRSAVDELKIPSCEGETTFFGHFLSHYQDGEKLYFIIFYQDYVRVYLDGAFIMEYEYDDLENYLETFWEEVMNQSE